MMESERRTFQTEGPVRAKVLGAGIYHNCSRNSKRPTRIEYIVSKTKGGGKQIKALGRNKFIRGFVGCEEVF